MLRLTVGMNFLRTGSLLGAMLVVAACGGGGDGGGGSGAASAPAANRAPTANAGGDFAALEFSTVVLDGTASSDPDGSIVSFSWRQLSGPDVGLTGGTTARAAFTAPSVSGPTDLVFELTVTDDDGAAATSVATVTVVADGLVQLSGAVTFDLVPVGTFGFGGAFLDYGNTQAAPARALAIEIIDASDGLTVLASGATDSNGAYSFTVPNFTNVFIRARAQMLRAGSPGWNFQVVDNTNGDALYVIDGAEFDTGGTDLSRDLHAASGWDGSTSYSGPRSAAPLAILDLVYEAAALIVAADPSVAFPPLALHWSPSNRPVFGANGLPNPDTGELGTSFYRSGANGGIFLLGAADEDTEEYDRHVIAHEWGHYLEFEFSRSDSIGGPHTQGDQLDLRVAFGEGWGNAFSAMAAADSVYKDTLGPQQSSGFEFDIEGESRSNSGWFNEFSIHEVLYDIFDAAPDTYFTPAPVMDNVDLGFGPLYAVLTNEQRTTIPPTSVFAFIAALKANNLPAADGIDALLGVHAIEPIVDDFGSTEDNAGNPPSADVLPVFKPITINGASVNVCSTDEFSGNQTGSVNKLGSRQYLRFQTGAGGAHTITATTTSAPAGTSTDPDMWLHRAGPLWPPANSDPTPECTPAMPSACSETFTRTLDANADYVLEIYEWTNTNASDDPDDPPIGRACFEVEITQP